MGRGRQAEGPARSATSTAVFGGFLEMMMEKVYLVWREESDRDDARRVKASYPEQAAKAWAQWADSWSADYSIVGGQNERVFVALDADGSEPEMFDVGGESMPVYYASAVSPNA